MAECIFDSLNLFINLFYNMHVTSIIKTLKIEPFFLHVYVRPSTIIHDQYRPPYMSACVLLNLGKEIILPCCTQIYQVFYPSALKITKYFTVALRIPIALFVTITFKITKYFTLLHQKLPNISLCCILNDQLFCPIRGTQNAQSI